MTALRALHSSLTGLRWTPITSAKVTNACIAPAIWRRLLLPRGLNFAQRHEIIQAPFGWTDSHLHQFVGGGRRPWIQFQTEQPRAANETYPGLVDGARHGPPEDVGGAGGYADFLEAWADPDHDDHRQMRAWVGRAFKPEAFDCAKTQKAINAALRKGLSFQVGSR